MTPAIHKPRTNNPAQVKVCTACGTTTAYVYFGMKVPPLLCHKCYAKVSYKRRRAKRKAKVFDLTGHL